MSNINLFEKVENLNIVVSTGSNIDKLSIKGSYEDLKNNVVHYGVWFPNSIIVENLLCNYWAS